MITGVEKKVSALDRVKELLKWGILWEDNYLMNEIWSQFADLQIDIQKENVIIEVTELASKSKNYNKLENMPLIILALLPINIQKQYATSMINTPISAIRWLYAISQYSAHKYEDAVKLLELLTLKFRDKAFTRDMFLEATSTEGKLNSYHKKLIKSNKERIKVEEELYRMAKHNFSEEYRRTEILLHTKEEYEQMFPTSNILDLLAFMNHALFLGVDPDLIKGSIKRELLTSRNVVLSKIFLACKQNASMLFKEEIDGSSDEYSKARVIANDIYNKKIERLNGLHIDLKDEVNDKLAQAVLYGLRDSDALIHVGTKSPKYMVPFLNEVLLASLEKLRKIPGKGVIIIDCSGSMKGSSVGEHLPCELMDLAFIMAYQAYMAFEKPYIILTAGRDMHGGGKHFLVNEDELGKIPNTMSEFYIYMKRAASLSMIGSGGIFTKDAMEFVRSNIALSAKDNVIVYCDSGDQGNSIWSSTPVDHSKILDCKVWIINVEHGTRGRGIDYGILHSDTYIKGHSNYLMELISLENGIASVYEKGAAVGGATFRDLFTIALLFAATWF